jgi:hypothetical protein
MSPAVEIAPSPEGVPGAFTDPTVLSGAIAEQLRERAAGSGQSVKVDVYEGAGHAFFADYRDSYRPGPAAKLWQEVVPFFAGALKGSRSGASLLISTTLEHGHPRVARIGWILA